MHMLVEPPPVFQSDGTRALGLENDYPATYVGVVIVPPPAATAPASPGATRDSAASFWCLSSRPRSQ